LSGRRPGELYAAAVVALRFAIVPAWIVVAVAATLYLPGPREARAAALGSFVPADSEAVQTQRRSAQLFDFPVLTNTIVVQRDPDGLSPQAQARAIRRAAAIGRQEYPELLSIPFAFPVVNTLQLFPGSRESSTTALTFLYFEPGVGLRDRVKLANWFMDVRVDRPDDAVVGKTGVVPGRVEQGRLISDALPSVELATVLLIALVIGANFRGVLAPALTLAAVAIAYLVSLRVVAYVGGEFGIAVPQEAEPVVLVLLLGLVTDYTIFYLSGLRHRLNEGMSRLEASRRTARDVGPIVFTAGLIVAAGAGSLVVAELEFFRVFGPALALSVLVGLAVAVTFVPAALALLGRAAYWPSRPGRVPIWEGRPERSRAPLALIARHRSVALLVVVVVTAGLAAAALNIPRIELALTPIRSLPADSEPVRAAAAAEEGFAAGILSPTLVLVEGDGIRANRSGLVAVQRLLEARRGVAGVVGPGNVPEQAPSGIVVAGGADAVRYVVVFDHEPLGSAAIETLRALRADLPGVLEQAGLAGARASIGGNTAIAEETIDTILDDLLRIAVAVVVVVFLLLLLFLRSLVAPLYLLAASVLAVAATLGLTVLAVEALFGRTELTYYVPFMAAVLLVSLGSDYNIFLVGRIWQEARERPLEEAIAVAGPRAAHAIGVAALALALSFALLVLVPLDSFREFAVAMVIGVTIDAFVVRTFLVPALVRLFGRASGWPGRLEASPLAQPPATPVGRDE
jgi:putative drug exporter of the RND superfamily